MDIGGYSKQNYHRLLMAISGYSIMAISNYFISGYWWLFKQNYPWLLMVI
jgi:hypothetical protein